MRARAAAELAAATRSRLAIGVPWLRARSSQALLSRNAVAGAAAIFPEDRRQKPVVSL
jgi:hypothetical protein